jgi:hypothetical protein
MLAEIIPKIAGMKAVDEWDDGYRPRPSSAGPERCIRSMVYHGLGVPKSPWPGRMVLTVDDSSWHEELTIDWIRQSAFQVHSGQMEIDCPPPMTKGHIDGIITDILGVDRLLEHKAINHFTFQKYWNNDELPLDYFTQCAIYISGLQKVNPAITEGILLIKNKHTAQYMEYVFYYPNDPEHDILTVVTKTNSNGETKDLKIHIPEIVNNAVEKLNQVQKYIETNTLPKRPYDMDSWRCEYCGWGHECWSGYEKEFTEMKTQCELPNEIADTVRFYKELGSQKSEIEKQYKELSGKVKSIMKELNIREGRAGEYICKLSLSQVERLDKTLLTETERLRATTTSMQERLTISSPARKELKNGSADNSSI